MGKKNLKLSFFFFLFFILSFYSVSGVIGGGFCIRGQDCEYNFLVVENLSVIGGYLNVTVINFNVTNDINVQGDVFATNIYGNLDSSFITSENWVNETREIGNQTFETSGDDVELRLLSDSNKHSYLYLMESSLFGFRLWYDGSGINTFKFDAIDNDVIKPQIWFDRNTADIDFFASIDMNDNNISSIDCIELNNEQICSWGDVNSSASSVFNDSMKIYVDNQDTLFNNSIKEYIDAIDLIIRTSIDENSTYFNNSMKLYVDTNFPTKTNLADNITVANDSMKLYVDGLNGTWNATELDGIDSIQFLRSDVNDTLGGFILYPNGTNPISLNHLVNKEFVELAVAGLELDYFFSNVNSDIPGYFLLNNTEGTAVQTLVTSYTLSAGADQLIFNFSTSAGLPFIFLSEGIYDAHIHLDKTGGAAQTIIPRWELYKRNATGEFLLMDSEKSDVEITTIIKKFDLHSVFDDDIRIVNTDRLVIKIIVDVTGGGSSTVRFHMEGNLDSHFTFRTPSSVLQEIFIRRDGRNQLKGNWPVGPYNITLSETLDTNNLIIRNPVTKSPTKCYWQFYNGSASECESITDLDIRFASVNITNDLLVSKNILHLQNITNPINISWGIFNNGSCIVIGDLSYVDTEC